MALFDLNQHHLSDLIMADSHRNQAALTLVLNLLKKDQIKHFSYLRISEKAQSSFVGTYDKARLMAYLKNDDWWDHSLYKPYTTASYRIVDPSIDMPEEKSAQYQSYVQDELSIFFDRHYQNYKDIFCFVINKTHYQQLSFSDSLKLYERLNAAADLCYSMIEFETMIQLPGHFNLTGRHTISAYQKQILDDYQLSQTQLSYLGYLSMGYTAKQISGFMNKSYRSVQDVIQTLSKKFNLSTKTQLTHVAKVIFSYFK